MLAHGTSALTRDVEQLPGLDDLADAVLTLRTRDEARRFLRDLCTLPELEALTHRWQTVRLLEEHVPVPRDRRARADQHGHRDPGRAVAAQRHRRLPHRARPDAREAKAALDERNAFTRAGSNGRLTLAVPSKGRMAEPALRLCADAGLSFEATDRALLVPCANAPVDLLLVRADDVPEYVQDGVVDLGITGANLVAEAAADVVTLAELGFARCTLQAAVPEDAPQAELRDLDGLRVATAYPASTRACLASARHRGRARPGLGLGRGGAAARALRRDRRSRLDRLDGERERAAPARDAARVAGRARRRRGGARRARELVERLELMLSGVVAARRRRYLMMNAPATALARDRARCSRAWARRRCSTSPSRADRRARGRRRRRRSGPAPAAEGGRRVARSSSCPSSGWSREGSGARRGAAARRARSSPTCAPAATRACSTGPSSSTASGRRAPRSAGASSRPPGSTTTCSRAVRALAEAVAAFSEAQRPRGHVGRGRPGRRRPSAAGCRSPRSGSTSRAAAPRTPPRS